MNRSSCVAPLMLLLVFASISCEDDNPAAPEPVPYAARVLFIGNSLTYTNYLPKMIDSLAIASGISIRSTEIASGGFGLIDHWNIPSRRTAVENGHFDVVILQQGPSSLPQNRDSLRIWSELWEPTIRGAGGVPGLFAVWPDKSRFFAFADVSESYRLAAHAVNGLFFPVGDVWLETWKVIPTAPLYGTDDFHPAVAGTYAAAVTIVAVLSGRDPVSLASRFTMPPELYYTRIDSTLAATIRAAAGVVLERNQQPGRPRRYGGSKQ